MHQEQVGATDGSAVEVLHGSLTRVKLQQAYGTECGREGTPHLTPSPMEDVSVIPLSFLGYGIETCADR